MYEWAVLTEDHQFCTEAEYQSLRMVPSAIETLMILPTDNGSQRAIKLPPGALPFFRVTSHPYPLADGTIGEAKHIEAGFVLGSKKLLIIIDENNDSTISIEHLE